MMEMGLTLSVDYCALVFIIVLSFRREKKSLHLEKLNLNLELLYVLSFCSNLKLMFSF